MPYYIFENPENGERREIRQRMADVHEYEDENGLLWNRVFTSANFAIDSSPDVFSAKSFADSTSNKDETVGDIMDRAKEAKHKRVEKLGYDPVQKKWFDDYASKRRGKRHPNDPSS